MEESENPITKKKTHGWTLWGRTQTPSRLDRHSKTNVQTDKCGRPPDTQGPGSDANAEEGLDVKAIVTANQASLTSIDYKIDALNTRIDNMATKFDKL